MTDDDPIDLGEVAADDAALDRLQAGALLADDQALLLMRDLLNDVNADMPAPVPVGCGTTVVSIAGESPVERRLARNGALVAAVAAGFLSLTGVAAASTFAPADSPLHGLGEVVRSAAGAVASAVTPPDSTPARTAVTLPSPAASVAQVAVSAAPRPTSAPGAAVSEAARSRAAARQVTALLDAAQQLLADGRPAVAAARLDRAERLLADVLPAEAEPLGARLDQLRSEVEAATAAPAPKKPAEQKPAEQKPAEQKPAEQKPAEQKPAEQKPDRGPKGEAPNGEPAAKQSRAPKGESPRLESPKADLRGQSSRDASTNPRA